MMGTYKEQHATCQPLSAHQRSPNDSFFTQIDSLAKTETEGDSEGYIGFLKDITKKHWKSVDSCKSCSNRACRKVFSSLLGRPHHCRRCGEIYCDECVKFKRRLNKLAHYDPDGELYKVCKTCFEQDQCTEGQSRSHTSDFTTHRRVYKNMSTSKEDIGVFGVWRSTLNFDAECERLIQGFAQSVGSSEILKTLHDLRTVLSTPDWMKSSVWKEENLAIHCQFCNEMFGLRKKKLFCHVCGVCVCKACSTKDLLLYIPDSHRDKDVKSEPKLAVIKFIGCPEIEPEVSLYLRVCRQCKDKQVSRQARQDEELLSQGTDFMNILLKIHQKCYKAEERVMDQLPKYRDVVVSLEDGSRKTNLQSNTKILAKAQEDLADVLAQHVTVVQELKKLKPVTETQTSLLKMYIRAKCEFYLEHMSQFRSLKHKLSLSVPTESLDFIQRIVDKNAIISTHLYLRQLVYETLHLCDKYKLEDKFPVFLMAVEQKVEVEVKACLTRNKEDIEEHMTVLKEMIRIRIKESKLIKPSKTLTMKRGSLHVQEVMVARTESILNQVIFQLQLASAHRSFQASKSALDDALQELSALKIDEENEAGGFIFLDNGC